jgi:hypothetical protein
MEARRRGAASLTDVLLPAEVDDGGVVRLLDVRHGQRLFCGDAGVPGRAIERRARGALRKAPRQGVFAAAAADDEDVDLVARGSAGGRRARGHE